MIKSYSTDEGEFWLENYIARDLNEREHFKWCNDFIDTFYPSELSDEELLTGKYHRSKFQFQMAVAKKRFCDFTGRGKYFVNEDNRWDFIFFGRGL